MPVRKAHARWEGSRKVDFGNGLFKGAYSFASRFEDGKGTNPEELLGAAHASCVAMALSLMRRPSPAPRSRSKQDWRPDPARNTRRWRDPGQAHV